MSSISIVKRTEKIDDSCRFLPPPPSQSPPLVLLEEDNPIAFPETRPPPRSPSTTTTKTKITSTSTTTSKPDFFKKPSETTRLHEGVEMNELVVPPLVEPMSLDSLPMPKCLLDTTIVCSAAKEQDEILRNLAEKKLEEIMEPHNLRLLSTAVRWQGSFVPDCLEDPGWGRRPFEASVSYNFAPDDLRTNPKKARLAHEISRQFLNNSLKSLAIKEWEHLMQKEKNIYQKIHILRKEKNMIYLRIRPIQNKRDEANFQELFKRCLMADDKRKYAKLSITGLGHNLIKEILLFPVGAKNENFSHESLKKLKIIHQNYELYLPDRSENMLIALIVPQENLSREEIVAKAANHTHNPHSNLTPTNSTSSESAGSPLASEEVNQLQSQLIPPPQPPQNRDPRNRDPRLKRVAVAKPTAVVAPTPVQPDSRPPSSSHHYLQHHHQKFPASSDFHQPLVPDSILQYIHLAPPPPPPLLPQSKLAVPTTERTGTGATATASKTLLFENELTAKQIADKVNNHHYFNQYNPHQNQALLKRVILDEDRVDKSKTGNTISSSSSSSSSSSKMPPLSFSSCSSSKSSSKLSSGKNKAREDEKKPLTVASTCSKPRRNESRSPPSFSRSEPKRKAESHSSRRSSSENNILPTKQRTQSASSSSSSRTSEVFVSADEWDDDDHVKEAVKEIKENTENMMRRRESSEDVFSFGSLLKNEKQKILCDKAHLCDRDKEKERYEEERYRRKRSHRSSSSSSSYYKQSRRS